MASNEIRITPSLVDDRGTWVVRMRVYNDPTHPKTYTKTRSTGLKVKDHTQRKAKSMMERFVDELMKSLQPEEIPDDTPLSYYIEKWITEQEKYRKENTILSYRQYATLHINPDLGDVQIRHLTKRAIQQYVDNKCQSLKVSSVKKHMVVINGAIKEAMSDELIESNVAQNIRYPKQEKFVGKAYTAEQVVSLFRAADKAGEPIKSAIILCVCYGLRREEVCGLRWSDINFRKKEIHIQNTVIQNGALVIEQEMTKTECGNRILSIMDGTYNYLIQLKKRHEELSLKGNKVVAWEDGRPLRPDYITRKKSALMKEANLEHIRLHDLRHTAATLLLTAEVPVFEVSKFLGHKDVSTTSAIYGHLMDEQRKKIAKSMDSLIPTVEFCSESCSV